MADFVAKAGEVGQWGVAGRAFGDRWRPGVLPSPSGCAENDGRLRSADDLCEPPQVLCDRCQREFELRATGASQAQPVKTQDALEVGKQQVADFGGVAHVPTIINKITTNAVEMSGCQVVH
jgi:hypothetical protein